MMKRSSPPSASLSRLGRYEILGRIATGGMATVYLAQLGAPGGFTREFALKVVHPHLTDDPSFRERFFEEARLAARVRHPNAVRTVDAGEDQGYRYQVLELIDGVNLRQLMVYRGRSFSPVQSAGIIAQVARGLSAVHQATDKRGRQLGMVHRDISPHNVMLDREGRAILIDLGLAKAEARELTQVGVMVGKLPYMSPEQARLEPLHAASDIFSLGTVLFELCTEQLPFGDDHSTSTYEALQHVDTVQLARTLHEHHTPAWLIEIITVCLRPNPQERFSSAADVADALSQELSRIGADEAVLHAEIAGMVAEAMPELGTTEAYDSGSGLRLRLQPRVESSVRPALRWTLASATVVTAVWLTVAGIWGSKATLERSPNAVEGTLASDQTPVEGAAMTPVIVPEPAAKPAPRPEPTMVELPVLVLEDAIVGDTDGVIEDPAPRLRRPRRRRDLKPNPYQR